MLDKIECKCRSHANWVSKNISCAILSRYLLTWYTDTHSFRVAKMQQNMKSCRTQLTAFLLSSMRHLLPCKGCDGTGSGGLEPVKPEKCVKK